MDDESVEYVSAFDAEAADQEAQVSVVARPETKQKKKDKAYEKREALLASKSVLSSRLARCSR